MKPLYLLIAILFCTCQFSAAQNLVPNPSFEIYDTCPNNISQITRCTSWKNFCGTPDYHNSCSLDTFFNGQKVVSVPQNFIGYQFAASGNGYVGIGPFELGPPWTEFIGSPLVNPLVVGKKYFVSFKISLADDANYACGRLGALFTTYSFQYSNPVSSLPNRAMVYSTQIDTNKISWEQIFGSFIADSVYNYIVLGDFFPVISSDTIALHSGTTSAAYYYLDDVCVSTDSAFAYNYSYSGISKANNSENKISIFPNPSNTTLTINFNENNFQSIAIVDVLGQQVFFDDKINSITKKEIDVSQFPDGVYIVQLNSSQARFNKKISVVHSK